MLQLDREHPSGLLLDGSLTWKLGNCQRSTPSQRLPLTALLAGSNPTQSIIKMIIMTSSELYQNYGGGALMVWYCIDNIKRQDSRQVEVVESPILQSMHDSLFRLVLSCLGVTLKGVKMSRQRFHTHSRGQKNMQNPFSLIAPPPPFKRVMNYE